MSAGRDSTGAVLSILIVTEAEFERPALFEAEQVSVVPVVLAVRFDVLQPVAERMPDSGSLVVQLTDTLLLYQPFVPAVPLTLGVMTGAVLSITVVSL